MTIIYLWVFILEALLVDGGRMRLAEAEAEEAQQMANESVMALYNEALYQYYDLFGQTKYQDTAELTKLINDYMKTQLGVYSENSAFGTYDSISLVSILQGRDYFDPFHFEADITDIGSGFSLNDEEVFKSQINDSMKYKGPVYLSQNFFDILGKMGGLKELNDAVQDSTNTVKETYSDYSEYIEKAKSVQSNVEEFLEDPTGEGHGDNLNNYAKEINDKLTLLASDYKDSILSYNSDIIDCRIEIYELENDKDDEDDWESRQKEIMSINNSIKSYRESKDALFNPTYNEAEELITEYIETLKKINERIGEESSDGLLNELQELENTANALINNKIAPQNSYLTNKASGSGGEYEEDIKDTYNGFAGNLRELHIDHINPSIEASRKYREGLNEIKNVLPSVDDVEYFLRNNYLPAFKVLLNNIRNDSRNYEDFVYVHEDDDEDEDDEDEDEEDDDWRERYRDSSRYEIRDEKYVIPLQEGKDYTIGTEFYKSGNVVDKFNKLVKSKTDNIESQYNKVTDDLKYEEEMSEKAGKEIDPNDSSSATDLINSSGESDMAEKMNSLSSDDVKDFSPANGHKFGKINGTRNKNETSTKYDNVSKKQSSEESVKERTDKLNGLSDMIGDVLKDGRDGLFECAYIMSYFRDYVHVGHMKKSNLNDKKYDTVLNTKFIDDVDQSNVSYLSADEFKKIEVTCAEAEYVLYGMADTKSDVAAAYAEIFAIRLILDYVSVWLTKELRDLVLKTSAKCGPYAPIVIAALPLAFSAPRALADMTVIMTAKKCPLIFTKKNDWTTNSWNNTENMVGYGDYLLMFLFVDFGETKIKRMQDVIETNMKALDANFSLDKAYVNLYVQSECSINYLFMSEAFIPSKWRRDKRHKFTVNTNFSY